MTGPEHYYEAERLLAALDETVQSPDAVAWTIAQAQVHATLALVASNAASTQSTMFTAAPRWREVATGEAYSG